MKNYNVEIVEKIKEKFVSLNRVIKSIKQLDFYINREKTPADIITKKKFDSFIKDNGFTSLYMHACLDRTVLSENDFKSVQQRLSTIANESISPKSLTVLEPG